MPTWLAITGGSPIAHEHDEIAWVSSPDLRSVAWLPSDAPLIDELATLLDATALSNGWQAPGASIDDAPFG